MVTGFKEQCEIALDDAKYFSQIRVTPDETNMLPCHTQENDNNFLQHGVPCPPKGLSGGYTAIKKQIIIV